MIPRSCVKVKRVARYSIESSTPPDGLTALLKVRALFFFFAHESGLEPEYLTEPCIVYYGDTCHDISLRWLIFGDSLWGKPTVAVDLWSGRGRSVHFVSCFSRSQPHFLGKAQRHFIRPRRIHFASSIPAYADTGRDEMSADWL
jgi:hypothetical protein